MTIFDEDYYWMSLAFSLAKNAESLGEVPVGAVIVRQNRLIATGFNLRETFLDPTAHAEVIAIKNACRALSSWRLLDCELYVTLEPCLMCAGAIYQSRLKRVIFGALDPKAGANGSLYSIHSDIRLNHRYAVSAGILASESSNLLKNFFSQRRRSSLESK